MHPALRASLLVTPLAVAVLVLGAADSFHAGAAAVVVSPAHADSAAVAGVINRFHGALASSDSSGALATLAGDAVILESGGVESRAEYRSHHLSGDIEFAKAVKSERGPLSVTVDGNTAWTTSTSTTRGEWSGRQINSVGAESMVLTRSKGAWKIRSIHWSSRTRRPPA